MIEAMGLCRRQGRLRDISLTCPDGSVTAILGPNGAGKSTLLDVLAGRSRADSGELRLNGRPLTAWPSQELARQRAFLPQLAEVAFPIQVRELVALGRSPYRGMDETRFDAEALEAALRLTDAWHLRERIYQQLSGGERQRVQLARVIAQIWRPAARRAEPRMLLLDEPTASLDPGHRLAVMTLLLALASAGIGIVIALHDLNDALRFADQVVVLQQGQLRGVGAPAAVLDAALLMDIYDAPAEILRLDGDQRLVVFG